MYVFSLLQKDVEDLQSAQSGGEKDDESYGTARSGYIDRSAVFSSTCPRARRGPGCFGWQGLGF